MYKIFIDGVLLPVTPSKLTLKVSNRNKTMSLVNESEINILKDPGLSEISFDIMIPHVAYPFATYEHGFLSQLYFRELLKQLKQEKKAFSLVIARFNGTTFLYGSSETVSLEEYTITEEAGHGFDLLISIKLRQWKAYGTKVLDIVKTARDTITIEEKVKRVAPVLAKTYIVKQGDTLWGICKKQLGNGEKYSQIAKLNNILDYNKITVGQVIRLA